MSTPNPSPEDRLHRRALAPAGHWHLPLDGHGLAYFDELEVHFRTLPKVDPQTDPHTQAVTQAAQRAAAAKAELDAAAKAAADAKTAAEAPNLDAATKAQRATEAAAKAQAEQAAAQRWEAATAAFARAQAAGDPRTAAATIILELIQRRKAGQALWSDVLILESALLRLLSPEQLKVKLFSLRQEYRDALGEAAYESIRDSLLDLKPDKPDPARMMAEADTLLGEIHWHYTTMPRLEWQKTRLVLKLGSYLGIVTAFILLFVGLVKCLTLAWIMVAGAFGASVSAVQRIQSTKARGNALLCIREAKWHTVSIGLAPILGTIFSILLMLAFAGRVIEGAVFPAVTVRTNYVNAASGENSPTNLFAAAGASTNERSSPVATTSVATVTATNNAATNARAGAATDPVFGSRIPAFGLDDEEHCKKCWCFDSCADLALMLLWAFIAGFSERLVPDLLSRISTKAQAGN